MLLATKIRERREERGMTIRALARAIEMSPSMISEVERGSANPSVETLAAIVRALDLSLAGLLEQEPIPTLAKEANPILRRDQRQKATILPGVSQESLTPNPSTGYEFTLVTYEPGAASCEADALIGHRGQEYGLVLSGALGLTAGFDSYELGSGDSIRLDSSIPHRVWAIGNEPATVLWTVLERGADPRRSAAGDADLNPG
jgi:transcriptional regulator with XRE-family HTH domain